MYFIGSYGLDDDHETSVLVIFDFFLDKCIACVIKRSPLFQSL